MLHHIHPPNSLLQTTTFPFLFPLTGFHIFKSKEKLNLNLTLFSGWFCLSVQFCLICYWMIVSSFSTERYGAATRLRWGLTVVTTTLVPKTPWPMWTRTSPSLSSARSQPTYPHSRNPINNFCRLWPRTKTVKLCTCVSSAKVKWITGQESLLHQLAGERHCRSTTSVAVQIDVESRDKLADEFVHWRFCMPSDDADVGYAISNRSEQGSWRSCCLPPVQSISAL